MTLSTIITDYLGVGVAASRPTAPTVATGCLAMYFATDTGVLSNWTGSAWANIVPLSAVANLDVLANISGGSAAPSGTTLTALIDAAIGSTQGDLLYRGASSWSVLAPGTSGNVLTTGGAGANPAWAAAGLTAIANNDLLANISGSSAVPIANTLTALIDSALGNTQGDILYRSGTVWTVLPPGSSGNVLTSGGAGANPAWSAGSSGTVTNVATGTGLTGGPVTGTGTISLAAIASLDLLANITGGSAAPIANTLTAVIDAAIGSTQGDILYRSGTAWSVLTPGTAGNVLTTGGAGANPAWAAAGLTAIANNDLLANISGSSAVPIANTLTALIDSALGSTQGDILYRSASAWTVLAPGTSGNVLTTGGAGANPSWAAGGGGGGALSGLTAATGANTIASGDNAQTWQWTLTTAAKSAFKFTEAAAATNGAGSQFLVDIDTIAASTAGPLQIKVQGTTALTIGNTGTWTYTAPAQGTTNANGLPINFTSGAANGTGTGGAMNLTAGAGGASNVTTGGAVTVTGGSVATSSSTGGGVTVQGGAVSGSGSGGAALFAGGDTTGSSCTGGGAIFRGGDATAGSAGGNVTLRSGNGGSSSGNSGTVTISTGASTSGNGSSGNITVTAGNTTNGGTAGSLSFTAGSNVGATLAFNINGGAISFTTGSGGLSNSNGGDYTIALGAKAGTGRNGVFKITTLPTTDPAVTGALYTTPAGVVASSGLGGVVTLTDGASIAVNLALGANYTVTLAGNRTLATPTNPIAGQTGRIVVNQDATGSRTLAYGANWKFPGGTPPTLSTAANAIDVLTYYCIDATHIAVTFNLGFA